MMLTVRCRDKDGECFARKNGYCMILLESQIGCKFKKPQREWTNGRHYPYNPESCNIDYNSSRIMHYRWRERYDED